MKNVAGIPEKDFDEMFETNFIRIGQFAEELKDSHPELSEQSSKVRASLSKRDRKAVMRRELDEKYVDILVDCPKEDAEFLDMLQDMYARWCQQKYIEYNLTKSGDML